MKRNALAWSLCSLTLFLIGANPAGAAEVKLTGWFACEKCMAPRAAKGDLRPSNPECAKKCIETGTAAVFVSEQGKELLRVSNDAAVKNDLGYHVEVIGEVDHGSKTIAIRTVKQLAYSGASCSRPRKAAK